MPILEGEPEELESLVAWARLTLVDATPTSAALAARFGDYWRLGLPLACIVLVWPMAH